MFLWLESQNIRAEMIRDFCYTFVASDGRRERKVILDIGVPESKEDSKVGETWKVKNVWPFPY